MPTGHRFLDHTGDLAFEAWAPDEASVLVEAARATTASMTAGAVIARRDRREVVLDGVTGDERLVRWLNEIIYLAITVGFVVADAELALTPTGLVATLIGEADAGARVATELKAATYHELALEVGPLEARCRVVIDV